MMSKSFKIKLVLLLLCFSFPVAAVERFNSKVIIKNSVEIQPSLRQFIAKLNHLVEHRNTPEIELRSFNDFADVIELYSPPLSEQANKSGWVALATMLKAKRYQKINGNICAPAIAKPVSSERPDEFWLLWGYVDGTNVFVRSAPSLKAKPIDSLSYEVVEPIQGEQGDSVKGLDGKGLWIEIMTSKGKRGYMYSTYFKPFKQKQLCYRQLNGHWKIVDVLSN